MERLRGFALKRQATPSYLLPTEKETETTSTRAFVFTHIQLLTAVSGLMLCAEETTSANVFNFVPSDSASLEFLACVPVAVRTILQKGSPLAKLQKNGRQGQILGSPALQPQARERPC